MKKSKTQNNFAKFAGLSLFVFALSFFVWFNFAKPENQIANATGTAPTITSISPNSGSVTGGQTVTITGSGFVRETNIDLSSGTINQAMWNLSPSSLLANNDTPTDDCPDAPTLDLQGARNIGAGVQVPVLLSQMANWSANVDFTGYSTLSFCVRKISNYGVAVVGVYPNDQIMNTAMIFNASGQSIGNFFTQIVQDPGTFYAKNYSPLPTDWTKINIDVSNLTGMQTLYLVGGYVDSSAVTQNAPSETQYSNVKLIAMPTVTINSQICSGVTVISDSELTCTVPAGTAGFANVAVTVAAQTATLANGYEYIAPCQYDDSLLANDLNCVAPPVVEPMVPTIPSAPNTGFAKE